MKDPLNLAAVVNLDSPQFGVATGCRVEKARYFCVPAVKTVVSAEDKRTHVPIDILPVGGPDAGDRICYKVKCPTSASTEQAVTDQFGNRTVIKLKSSLVCTPAVKGAYQRFVDNGDGTVIDHQTGLQWEKKTTAVGSGVNLADPHDVDNTYTWNTTFGGTTPNGTAFTDFLGTLNACVSVNDLGPITNGFAGHCDWRLPSNAELRTILLDSFPCATHPCIDPIFGPTVGTGIVQYYWTATTVVSLPDNAWIGDFFEAVSGYAAIKFVPRYVRAVRGP
jgi:hypothetical protein